MNPNNLHIALLGDSIFDNAAYTGGLPDLVTHLGVVTAPGAATLLAIDGSVCDEMHAQLGRVPDQATPLLDLHRVCTGDADYYNDIEPSSAGALKIARAVQEIVEKHDFSAPRTTIYPLL